MFSANDRSDDGAAALLRRYRAHYRLPPDIPLSENDLRRHLAVELAVADRLLAAPPHARTAAFAEGYERIYRELWWFGEAERRAEGAPPDISPWRAAIGSPPARVYEVGSGEGALARALGAEGYHVTATDISAARGGARAAAGNVRWGETDGVHLSRFAEPGTFDAVISDQVVEHLHPDDLLEHLRGARDLLRPGGCYAFRTPHGPSGPYDSSLVFGLPVALGTHLREYSFGERVQALRIAGFRQVLAVRPDRGGWSASAGYARYLVAVERALGRIARGPRRVLIKRVLRDSLVFHRNAMLVGVR